ncbi:hypothetical protein DFJ74DRAFT_688729 [Hyaloraphidium curvatum]|nr:hypothetical protein DFJ74DRAFT_688729 [Hyaloraphidium curvatum]
MREIEELLASVKPVPGDEPVEPADGSGRKRRGESEEPAAKRPRTGTPDVVVKTEPGEITPENGAVGGGSPDSATSGDGSGNGNGAPTLANGAAARAAFAVPAGIANGLRLPRLGTPDLTQLPPRTDTPDLARERIVFSNADYQMVRALQGGRAVLTVGAGGAQGEVAEVCGRGVISWTWTWTGHGQAVCAKASCKDLGV